jgi:anti-sigma factor RsiW
MNPDKLFDYLDGRLSEKERAEIERQLATDSQLQRELAIARQIHSNMGDSREVFAPYDPTSTSARGAVLGRRIAITFVALVFANVLFGIYAIAFMKKRQHGPSVQDQNRQQLAQAFENAAASALPTPILDVDEIKLTAPAPEQNALADKVIAAAQRCDGSGAKGLTDEHGILLFTEVPAARLKNFHELLRKLGATLPTSSGPNQTGEKSIVQVRITDGAKQ